MITTIVSIIRSSAKVRFHILEPMRWLCHPVSSLHSPRRNTHIHSNVNLQIGWIWRFHSVYSENVKNLSIDDYFWAASVWIVARLRQHQPFVIFMNVFWWSRDPHKTTIQIKYAINANVHYYTTHFQYYFYCYYCRCFLSLCRPCAYSPQNEWWYMCVCCVCA